MILISFRFQLYPAISFILHFSEKLRKDLTRCRNGIRADVNKKFKSYLETVWSNAGKIGCNAMKLVMNSSEAYKQNSMQKSSRSPMKLEAISALTHSKYTWEQIDDRLGDIEDVIDFRNLYKCQLIFNTLEKDDEAFGRWYVTHRKDQLSKLLQTGFGKECKREKISDFFEQVLGFFIIETYVVQSNKRIVCWDTVCKSYLSPSGKQKIYGKKPLIFKHVFLQC